MTGPKYFPATSLITLCLAAVLTALASLPASAATPGANPGAATGTDWPQWRGPNRDGVSTETNWSPTFSPAGPRKLWTAQVGPGFSTVSISKGRLYTMGNVADQGAGRGRGQDFTPGQDTIWCLDALTGKEIWHYTYPAAAASWDGQSKQYPGTRATPTVDGNFVYTMSLDAQLLCLTADKGTIVWKKNLIETYQIVKPEYRWGSASSPLIVGKVLYQSLGAGACALEKDTGKEIWHWHDEDNKGNDNVSAGYASPLLFDNGGSKALAVLTKALVALDPATGHELWRVGGWQPYGHGLNAADPVFLGDKVFLSQGNYTRDCAVFQFGRGSRTEKVWRLANAGLLVDFHTPALYQGNLYGFHDGVAPGSAGGDRKKPAKSFCCLDFATGKTLWSTTDLPVTSYGNVLRAGDKLILLTDKGELTIAEASPEGFKPLSRAKVMNSDTWVSPVLCNGLIYCRSNKGELICLDLRKKTVAEAQ